MTNLELYKKFEAQLLEHRLLHGIGSPSEFPIIDNMEVTWYTLTPEEQQLLDSEGSQCFPSQAFNEYKQLTIQLRALQSITENVTKKEEELLDKMDQVWYNIPDKERQWLKRHHEEISS